LRAVAKTKGKARAAKVTRGKRPRAAAQPAAPKRTPSRAPVVTPASPAPPAPPPPPPPRDELAAPRDVARLLRYGERFAARKIDVRMMPLQLPVSSGQLAVVDPGAPKSWRVFDRPVGSGAFRVMLSVARDESNNEKLAAIVIHVGRPPITRWTVAHYAKTKAPKSADQLPRCPITSGWLALIDAGSGSPGTIAVPPPQGILPIEVPLTDGRRALALPCGDGEFAAYWAIDSADKPICLVVDFDVFTLKEWKARPPAS
jgi:hypothetical protein